jgi:hypothetical protein
VIGMKRSRDSKQINDWVSRQLQGTVAHRPGWNGERRDRADRRRRVWWSVWYGSFNPRRRRPPRRLDDSRYQSLDWHSAHLLAVAVGIVLLCAADAFLTVDLLHNGAEELNPVMEALLFRSVAVFTALKMAMTGIGTLMMVFLARYRLMRVLRVEMVLYAVLLGYLALIGYEISMLKGPIELPIL